MNFWPGGHRFAYVLTHDVEGPAGIENIERVRKVERAHGVVSSWNFVAEDYPIPTGLFEKLRADGCEIGLHGIHHDRRLWRNEQTFERTLPKIHRYLAEWQAVGWRSPVTYRNADWMPRLGALYDSSFPDTDPFEPQAGGCCSIFPFFLDDMVELPITLVQDHTMWELLQQPGIDLWLEKSRVDPRAPRAGQRSTCHPDYLIEQDRLDLYDEFLGWLTAARRRLARAAARGGELVEGPRADGDGRRHVTGADGGSDRRPRPRGRTAGSSTTSELAGARRAAPRPPGRSPRRDAREHRQRQRALREPLGGREVAASARGGSTPG